MKDIKKTIRNWRQFVWDDVFLSFGRELLRESDVMQECGVMNECALVTCRRLRGRGVHKSKLRSEQSDSP